MAFKHVREIFAKMPEAFDPNAAKGLDATIRFDITGSDGGQWSAVIRENTCTIEENLPSEPSVVLTMSDQTWIAMVNRELNGMQAFMTGKLRVKGNILLAQRIYELFPL
ncbi:SCP2 sterol-binding domain-containing protein [Desulfatiglans anilini]|uniref:SCP2 sterol-binding domain-containing protein n=1 Tax=Desulfatiglans anilini TaxID=90728 RepID=UPI00040C5396|nr:SCP2 sterol-binding domain-containing protein [Desulfatiglans anilini]